MRRGPTKEKALAASAPVSFVVVGDYAAPCFVCMAMSVQMIGIWNRGGGVNPGWMVIWRGVVSEAAYSCDVRDLSQLRP